MLPLLRLVFLLVVAYALPIDTDLDDIEDAGPEPEHHERVKEVKKHWSEDVPLFHGTLFPEPWNCEPADPALFDHKTRTPALELSDMFAAYGSGRDWDREAVRHNYQCLLYVTWADVKKFYQSNTADECALARGLVAYRSNVKFYLRERGSWFLHKLLAVRDAFKYGFAGASFETVYARHLSKDPDESTVCSRIVESAASTNVWYNKRYDKHNQEL